MTRDLGGGGAAAPPTPPESETHFLGADLLVMALAANGYHVVPLNPGATEEVIASALERGNGVAPVLAYQELTALGFAAEVRLGSAVNGRSAGSNGCRRAAVIAHGMVGLGGMASFITGFAQQKLPILVLVGNAGVTEDSLGRHQNPNGALEQLARGAGCKSCLWVTGPESLIHQLKRASMLAEGGTPGPVALVPQNGVMAAPVSRDTVIEEIPGVDPSIGPSSESVRELARRLLEAESPVIIVGDGVARSDAVTDVVEVAERTGAAVIGSMTHELCFPMNHPQWAGSTGHLFGEHARDLLADADCVVSVGGVDVSTVFPTVDAPYQPGTWVTYVGDDPAAAAAMYRNSSSPVIASPKVTMRAIAQAVSEMASPVGLAAVARRTGRLVAANAAKHESRLARADAERKTVPLHAYDVALGLRDAVDALGIKHRVILVNEALTRAQAVEDVLRPSLPGHYFLSQGGSLGYAGPMASGIAQVNPDKTVIAFSGDGGFLCTPQWMLNATENGLNIKCIVFQDDTYGLLVQAASAQGRTSPDTFLLGNRRARVDHPAPVDFVKLAAALGGVRAECLSTRAQVAGSMMRLLSQDGPALIEARTPVVAGV